MPSFMACITDVPNLQSSSLLLSIFIKHLLHVILFWDEVEKGKNTRIICPRRVVISGTFLQYWVLINFISYFISSYTAFYRFVCLNIKISFPFIVKLYNFSWRRQNTQSLLHRRVFLFCKKLCCEAGEGRIGCVETFKSC